MEHKILVPVKGLGVFFLLVLLLAYIFIFHQYSKTEVSGNKDFASYSKASEAVRNRFLWKKAKLFELGEPLLWEAPQDLRYVWSYFPPTWTCPHLLERVGHPSDGGKWVCGLELFEKSGIFLPSNPFEECVIYSFGISSETTFEQEVLERTNCQLFAYDHTIKSTILQSKFSDRVKFRSTGVKAKNGTDTDDRLQTLKEIMQENGHSWIDFLKMDIEGAEFEVLTDIAKDFETWPFGHLNVEIHLIMELDNGDKERAEFTRFNNLWTLLEEKGLRALTWEDNLVAQTRRNNCSNLKPTLVEYAFLNILDNRNKLIQF